MSLEANDLVLFARVVDAGSFSQAAERAGLPKSTLSRRISQLESTLGERLLVRTTRRLTLTDFGASLLEHARRLLAETEAAAAFASSRQGTPRGLLRVSLPPDFAELDLSQLILQYATQYPEVQLEVDLSPRRVDLLADVSTSPCALPPACLTTPCSSPASWGATPMRSTPARPTSRAMASRSTPTNCSRSTPACA